MSNLGWYQFFTTVAKKVGGPKNLLAIVFGGGALFGGGVAVGGTAIKKQISSELEKKRQKEGSAIIYTVKNEGRSNEGLMFKTGDQFKVLETDGDAGLIEIIGNDNNPYFVSIKFLMTISDYKHKG